MADIDKIKGNFYVYSNGEYVILPATRLYILKADGSLVACRKDLRYAGRITFLSNNRMLLCSSKAVFHMINLADGTDLWTAPYTKSSLNVANLAISPDEAYAYTYDKWKTHHFISRLDLRTQDVDVCELYMDVGGTGGILCDEGGTPCLLKTLTETIGGRTVHQSGVRIHDFSGINPGGTTNWKTKWSFTDRSSFRFFDSTDRIVTRDLKIYRPSTGELYDLLENEASWQCPPGGLLNCWLDLSKRYLCVSFLQFTVIIDIPQQKVAARYAVKHRGCLMGDEYWVCVNDKFCRKPFPAFEEIPPAKPVFGFGIDYSKHPELW